MAKSYNSYVGNGSTQVFSLSFPYLAQSHVKVYVGGVEDTTFTWLTSSSLTLSSVPASGDVVLIKRVTPTTPLIDFVDGSVVTESLLDTATIQSMYIAEETQDTAATAIIYNAVTDVWEGNAKRLSNLADPVNAQDAVTKDWAETGMSSQLIQATAQATTATAQATIATTQATNAAASASTATTKASEASTSATNSANSATASASSATSAASSATTATTKASEASSSATSAASSASTATTQATSASASATAAASSASTASSAATSATGSAATASTAATTATTKANEASSSATSAASSASSASTSASTATSQAANASASATSAGNSATNAASSEFNAAASATSAASSLSAANAAQLAAETARDQTLTAFDNFDDRYLGQKTSDPTVDNDGNPLLTGALYYNTTGPGMKVYEGSGWVSAYASLSGALLATSNLSDLTNTTSARSNLGLVIGTDVQAYSAFIPNIEASQVEMETGTETALRSMSPLRVKQAIDANSAPAFPSGTRLAFQQTSAPTGWTKDTTAGLDDSVMRIVTGTASSGGSTAFSTFNGQTSVGATTLTTSQVPNATGQLWQMGNRAGSGSGNGVFTGQGGTGYAGVGTTAAAVPAYFDFSLGFGGGSHTHSMTTAIKYFDFIIASKD